MKSKPDITYRVIYFLTFFLHVANNISAVQKLFVAFAKLCVAFGLRLRSHWALAYRPH